MESRERAQERLDRIRAIQPVLTALRTISLATWRTALRRRSDIQPYREQLTRIGQQLAAQRPQDLRRLLYPDVSADTQRSASRVAVVVVGSERGLCGAFNAAVVARAEEYLATGLASGAEVELMALGARVARALERRDHHLVWAGNLSLATLPTFHRALELTSNWLGRYGRGELMGVDVVCNDYLGMGRYEPRVRPIVPPAAPDGASYLSADSEPGPIVETDPDAVWRRLVEQLAAAQLHEALISSAAAEHSTRYQLMDGASQNAERITDQLALEIQTARQQAITREMQELAAGAGMIGPRAG